MEKSRHINIKELLALERALIKVGDRLYKGTLLWKCDNMVVQMVIFNQGLDRSTQLCQVAVRTLLMAERSDVVIEPR